MSANHDYTYRLDAGDVSVAIAGCERRIITDHTASDRECVVRSLRLSRYKLDQLIRRYEAASTVTASTFDVAYRDLAEGDECIITVGGQEERVKVKARAMTSRKSNGNSIIRIIWDVPKAGELWQDYDCEGLVRVVDNGS